MAATVSYWFTVGCGLTGKRKARAGRAMPWQIQLLLAYPPEARCKYRDLPALLARCLMLLAGNVLDFPAAYKGTGWPAAQYILAGEAVLS